MANEILKGVAKGINEGVSKSPFPNPISSVSQGINNVKKGNEFFVKKKQAEALKVQKAKDKEAKTQRAEALKVQKTKDKEAKIQKVKALKIQKANDKVKQTQGKEYLKKIKATLEGNKKPDFTGNAFKPAIGVAGTNGYVPKQPILPKVHVKKQLLTK